MSRPPFNLDVIEAMTPQVVAAGHRIFQTHRFAKTDEEHVARLMEWLAPRHGSVILDNGCGIGEVSRLMSQADPTLTFILANISPTQLDLCPRDGQFIRVHCDSHELPVPDGFVDAVMFSSALAQMDEAVALAEAHRVTRVGGTLLLNELVRVGGDGDELEALLACRTLTRTDLLATVERAGYRVTAIVWPNADDEHFRELLAADGLLRLADGVRPILIRAIKEN